MLVSAEVVALLRGAGVPKGDTLAVARLAGIMGAKQTPVADPAVPPAGDLRGDRRPRPSPTTRVEIAATVRTTDRTGVEMEALTAVSVAALTVIDMVKAVDKARRDHRRAGRDQDRRQVRRLGAASARS